MKKSRFSEEQIIGMIKEQEGGVPTAEVCRKHGISTASFYKYKLDLSRFRAAPSARLSHFPFEGDRALP
ncbi:transposase, partial [Sulfitobacter sp. MF3-043]|uniref:transposase n=1 Tax=Sulfitobacter sediminivivens TaxID=3252902 RepID=UPI0036DB6C73